MPDRYATPEEHALWQSFCHQENLNMKQLSQFKRYYELIISWSQRINLTTITEVSDVIAYHFGDSLAIKDTTAWETVHMIADVGSGAGFPGIPLKIKYPSISVVLIEVTQKRINFLQSVIEELGLIDITVVPYDWRTFVRKTSYPIDCFCARASLRPDDLITIFNHRTGYRAARICYWSSIQWQPSVEVECFVEENVYYTAGQKKRKLVLLKSW